MKNYNKKSEFNPEEYIDSLDDFPKHWQRKQPEEITSADIINDPYLTDEEKQILLTPEDYSKLLKEKRMEKENEVSKIKHVTTVLAEMGLSNQQIKELIDEGKINLNDKVNLSDSEGQSPPEITIIIQGLNSVTDSLNQLSEEVFNRCLKLYPLSPLKGEIDSESETPIGYLDNIHQRIADLNKIYAKFELANQILTKIVG